MNFVVTDEGRVLNELGHVAMSYTQPIPKHVIMPDKMEYTFTLNHDVSMAFVKPEHVDEMLKHKRVCCGGATNPAFRFTSLANVQLWMKR